MIRNTSVRASAGIDLAYFGILAPVVSQSLRELTCTSQEMESIGGSQLVFWPLGMDLNMISMDHCFV